MGSDLNILVRQVRSANGRCRSVKDTLSALGLGRIGKKRLHKMTPEINGMLRKVQHLVRVVKDQ